MKLELVPRTADVPRCYPRADWWTDTLRYSIAGGWVPALPCRADIEGGLYAWETYRPDMILTAADGAALAAGLEHWFDILGPRVNEHAKANDFTITSRVDFSRWLRQAGDVHIRHNETWRPDRLTGARGVRLSNAAGEAVELTPETYYTMLTDAVSGGWVPARAENDEHPSASIFRPDAYDVPGAVIGDPDAEQMVAALRTWHTMLALPAELIPAEPLRTFARVCELHQTGRRRRGAGWIRVQVTR